MEQMGFSQKWRKWIFGCLDSAFGSVLVNGSPTKEFKIQKGVCQGDPLSPFLFSIAIEALHVTIQEAKQKYIFEGIQVGSNKIGISHLQFVDDALIMGKCFASILRFQPSTLPCTYLGIPIGSNMNKSSNWKPVIDKFHKKLTSWKVRTLSYGGRLTLLKSVLGALGTYFFSLFKAPKCVINYLEKLRRNFVWGGYFDCNKMTWITWNKICSSSKNGGLGVGSLHASNLAMVGKWWWHFHSKNNTLWKNIIISIHGEYGGLVNWPVTAASKSAFVGVLFSVVPSSRIISCPSASNSGSSSDCSFLSRLSDDLRDNCGKKKDDLWSIVKEKFSFESDHSEKNIKEWIMSDMSTKWKCWKYELKKSSYDPTMTINEIVASQTDDRVETGQFRTLVESWFTEEKQVESERKKINRLKSIEPHVTGTKSFARVKDEETKKNNGVSPSRGGMYCITRTRKDGSIVNAVAAQVVADIKAIGDSSSTDQEITNNSDWTNDDLSKVKGTERRGLVKYLRQGFMMFVAAVQEQVPNLNLSFVMNFMNMEVYDLSSIHDNMTGKNPSSASGTSNHQNSHF
ncbi:putative RNA-directed DNA polymerase, eukaryota, reverse transcriptase zinc-binding domain protein, partial [Tanacetum coccineum]